ncbi:MAG: ABC transporter ATP-binding protein, partial [Shewanella sp.]
MREALTFALQDFDGALIVVSHDRHILRATVDDFWLIEDGRVGPFDGDLDDYTRYSQEKRSGDKSAANAVVSASQPATNVNRKEQKRLEAEARQKLANARKPLEKDLARIEAEMARITAEQATITATLADETLYLPERKDALQKILASELKLKEKLAEREAAWMAVSDEIENLVV